MKHIQLSEFESNAIVGILEGDASDPVSLIKSVGLDPVKFFNFADCQNIDFRKSDLNSILFLNSDLRGAIFTPKQIEYLSEKQNIYTKNLIIADIDESFSPNINKNIHIRLIGPFRMLSKTGDDLSPRGAKSRALIALLATSPNYQRPRKWLQDKLWSDRAEEQGAASLRQALTEIRRHLAQYPNVFYSDRSIIRLNSEEISVDIDDFDPDTISKSLDGVDFLEGLEIPDDVFEDWLRQTRAELARSR